MLRSKRHRRSFGSCPRPLDTGYFCGTSFAARLSNSDPATTARPVLVFAQDHCRAAVAVTGPLAGTFLEPLALFFGQIFPGRSLEFEVLRGTVRFTMVEG